MSMKSIQVSLPDELEAAVAAAVARGEYASRDDAIRDAVADWHAQRMIEAMGLDELRRLWWEGIDSGPGRSLTIDEIKAEARRRSASA